MAATAASWSICRNEGAIEVHTTLPVSWNAVLSSRKLRGCRGQETRCAARHQPPRIRRHDGCFARPLIPDSPAAQIPSDGSVAALDLPRQLDPTPLAELAAGHLEPIRPPARTEHVKRATEDYGTHTYRKGRCDPS